MRAKMLESEARQGGRGGGASGGGAKRVGGGGRTKGDGPKIEEL